MYEERILPRAPPAQSRFSRSSCATGRGEDSRCAIDALRPARTLGVDQASCDRLDLAYVLLLRALSFSPSLSLSIHPSIYLSVSLSLSLSLSHKIRQHVKFERQHRRARNYTTKTTAICDWKFRSTVASAQDTFRRRRFDQDNFERVRVCVYVYITRGAELPG